MHLIQYGIHPKALSTCCLLLLATMLHHGNWKAYQRATTGADSITPLFLASIYLYISACLCVLFFFPPPDRLPECACRKHYLSADGTTDLLQSQLSQGWQPCRNTSHLRCMPWSKPLELGRVYLEQPTSRTATDSPSQPKQEALL